MYKIATVHLYVLCIISTHLRSGSIKIFNDVFIVVFSEYRHRSIFNSVLPEAFAAAILQLCCTALLSNSRSSLIVFLVCTGAQCP